MGRKRAVRRSQALRAAQPHRTTFRRARPESPPPADGNVYREIVQDRIAAQFGPDAVRACWSMRMPEEVMLHPAGPVHQALDRLDDLRLSKVTLSKTAERSVFFTLVKQWQQGYLGAAFKVQERHRKVGRKTAAANRRKKAAIDADRAATIVAMYQRARRTLEPGHAGDVEARRNVARRWEASTGFPITDRTIRNILDSAGISRHRRPRSGA